MLYCVLCADAVGLFTTLLMLTWQRADYKNDANFIALAPNNMKLSFHLSESKVMHLLFSCLSFLLTLKGLSVGNLDV